MKPFAIGTAFLTALTGLLCVYFFTRNNLSEALERWQAKIVSVQGAVEVCKPGGD